MAVLLPRSLDETVDLLRVHPEALVLAGGTDLMVEVNEGHRRLAADDVVVVGLTHVPELSTWSVDPDRRALTLGAGIVWRLIERDPLASFVPALAEAARTVGSPQIRNAGTIGGNLATCSPAGDGLPVLAALDATAALVSGGGTRTLPVSDFMLGVKRTALEPGELIGSVTMPLIEGWQGYSKVGVRNAMVIATASTCVVIDTPTRSVRVAMGSVAPTIVRSPAAELFAAESIDWDTNTVSLADAERFGSLAAADCRPITDHRSTAEYRSHAVGVMARRLLLRGCAALAEQEDAA